MLSFKRLKRSRAAKNAGSSYLAFFSTAACTLFSIPIAVRYLPKEEIGLWSVVQVIVGYLVWLDLGVGDATGRKIAHAIAHDDRPEINRWWTLSVGVLAIQGALMAMIGLGMAPLLPQLLGFAGGSLERQAVGLFIGLALVLAIGMPMRAYPGILLAQERFHWVPLTQAMMPWVQFGVFWALLAAGIGVYSYMWGLAAAYIAAWCVYIWQVHGMGLPMRFDRSGFTRKRFSDLFHYSGNLALNGIATAVLASIPSLILTKLGGLSIVPVYNFTQRGPGLITSLSQRTSHAFTPNLQRLYVSGERERFRAKFREVNQLVVWISLGVAGVVLAINRPFISWLANAEFYAGHWTNLWFACGCLVVPFSGNVFSLLQYSGNMGKAAIFTLAQIAVSIPLAWWAKLQFGLPGVAAVFVLLPLLLKTPYGWIRGARNCGFTGWNLCGKALICFTTSFILVITAGTWIASNPAPQTFIEILDRTTSMPTYRELASGTILGVFAIIMSFMRLKVIQKTA